MASAPILPTDGSVFFGSTCSGKLKKGPKNQRFTSPSYDVINQNSQFQEAFLFHLCINHPAHVPEYLVPVGRIDGAGAGCPDQPTVYQ